MSICIISQNNRLVNVCKQAVARSSPLDLSREPTVDVRHLCKVF
jgi:hypothetical protein